MGRCAKFGLFALTLAALVAGGCAHSVGGVVRERLPNGDAGAPIADAEIVFRSTGGEILRESATGESGAYFVELPRGRYGVEARHPLFESATSDAATQRSAAGGATVDLDLVRRRGTVVYLVRHAEKADASRNTSLAAGRAGRGLERAAELARRLAGAGLEQAFATGLCRTAQTADPAALAAGLTIRYQAFDSPEAGLDDADCEPDIGSPVEPLPGVSDEASYARAILAFGAGAASLVAGHSNTVPALVEALGAPSLCPGTIPFDAEGRCWLPDHEYHHLFVVTVPGGAAPRVEAFGFGRPSEAPPDS